MANDATDFWAGLTDILSAADTHELRQATMAQLGGLGFRAAYFLAPVTPDPRVGRVLTNVGFPEEWADAYAETYRLIDPLPGLALRKGSAFHWRDADAIAELSLQERGYLDRIADLGMGNGIAVPCFGPNLRCGFMGVGMPRADAPMSEAVVLQAQMIGQMSFQRYCEVEKAFDTDLPQLSERELQVLTLICEGKSNQQIGHALALSRGTIDVYLKRLFAKLGVNDRASASVQAIARGLVVSGAYPTRSAEN